MIAASRNAEASDTWLRQLVQDAELHELFQKGIREYDTLDVMDKRRFALMITQFLRAIEGTWTQNDLGFVNEDQWYGYEVSIREIVGSPGGLAAYSRIKQVFSPKFRSAIEQILSDDD